MYWDSDRTLEVFRGTFGGTYHHPEPSIGIWSLDAARGTTMETKSELLSARMMTNLKWKREHGRSCPKRSTNWASPPGDGSFLRIQAQCPSRPGGCCNLGTTPPLDIWVEPQSGNRQETCAFVFVRSFWYVNQVITATKHGSTIDAFSQVEQSRVGVPWPLYSVERRKIGWRIPLGFPRKYSIQQRIRSHLHRQDTH